MNEERRVRCDYDKRIYSDYKKVVLRLIVVNKANERQRKPKGQSIIDNPETLATLGKHDTGRKKNNKENYKDKQYGPHQKPG